MNKIPSNRLAFIDTAKGLGILAVVAGHIYPNDTVHSVLYLFHMPLFFFISGYLFKVNDNRVFFYDKLQQLIVPYLSFLLIIYTAQNLHFFKHMPFSYSQLGLLYFKAMLGGRWLYGYTAAFWFVPVLFIVLVTANWLIKKVEGRILLLIALGSLAGCYLNSMYFASLKLPLNVNVVLAAFPIFLAGFYFRKQPSGKQTFITCILVAISVPLAFLRSLPAMDMKMAIYGLPVFSFTAAIAISLLVFYFSELIAEKLQLPAAILKALGQASLVIMFLHQPVQIFLQNHSVQNNHFRTALSLLIPDLAYCFFKSNLLCRVFFLGSKAEWVAQTATGKKTINWIVRHKKPKSETSYANP